MSKDNWLIAVAQSDAVAALIRTTNLTQVAKTMRRPAKAKPFRPSVESVEVRYKARVKACDWTQKNHYGIVGTAFDLLVGSRENPANIDRVIVRASNACAVIDRRFEILADPLREILSVGPVRMHHDGSVRRHRDYFRATLLLAELDSVFRSGAGTGPLWVLDTPNCWTSTVMLRRALRGRYPVAVVSELHALIRRGTSDLPSGTNCEYNPTFGQQIGSVFVKADGDLLFDDTLIELKVSINKCPNPRHVMQLLGYVALDRMQHPERIQKIAVYNPRRGLLWVECVDVAARALGWCGFSEFVHDFEVTVAKFGPARSTASAELLARHTATSTLRQ